MSVQARRRASGLRQTLEQPLPQVRAGIVLGGRHAPAGASSRAWNRRGGTRVNEEAGTVPARDRWGRYVRRDGIRWPAPRIGKGQIKSRPRPPWQSRSPGGPTSPCDGRWARGGHAAPGPLPPAQGRVAGSVHPFKPG